MPWDADITVSFFAYFVSYKPTLSPQGKRARSRPTAEPALDLDVCDSSSLLRAMLGYSCLALSAAARRCHPPGAFRWTDGKTCTGSSSSTEARTCWEPDLASSQSGGAHRTCIGALSRFPSPSTPSPSRTLSLLRFATVLLSARRSLEAP